MTGFRYILISLALASTLEASPITDPYVKNLTLVGVIHVEGAKAKGQSVAVLRERLTGRTRILHKGDSITDMELELRDLGPQQVTLVRGQQTFVLRVENNSETSASLSNPVESIDVELLNDKNPGPVVELPAAQESSPDPGFKSESPADQRRLIPDPDCPGDDCPAITE